MAEFLPPTISSGPRYYCHQCEAPFRPPQSELDNIVCPNCQSEFVEVIENEAPHPPLGTLPPQPLGSDTDDPEQEQVRFGPPRGFPAFQAVPGAIPFLSMRVPGPRSGAVPLQEHLRNVMASRGVRMPAGTQGAQATTAQARTQTSTQSTSQASSKTSQTSSQRTSQRDSSDPPPARRPRQDPPHTESTDGLADLHFSVGMPWYFMLNHRQHARREQQQHQQQQQQQQQQQARGAGLGNAMLGTPVFLGFGGGPGGGFLHSSPGDYVWGPHGIDMISEMLASLDDPGPPPAEQSKIDSLPTVLSTAENMKACSLCSVCKEDFCEGESLIKLPCEHLYHKDCIFPWLKLHDTCPTCRFHLNTGQPDDKKGPV